MEADETSARSTSSSNEKDASAHVESVKTPIARKSRIKEGIFLAALTGFSVLGGFGLTIAMAKKKDPNMFTKGLFPTHELPDSGGSLAVRALGWGTLYAVTGVGSLCFAVWKLLGVKDLSEFRQKMGHALPKIPKKENQGRQEFESIRDLFEYLIEEDNKKKSPKGS